MAMISRRDAEPQRDLNEISGQIVEAAVPSKQLLTYLKLMDYRLGLLVNFGASLLKDGIKRIANNF
jgi:hypothetical protein